MERKLQRGIGLAIGLGLGVGLMLGVGFMAFAGQEAVTDADVRERARVLGMVDVTALPPAAPACAEPPPPQQIPAKPVARVAVAPGVGFYWVGEMLAQAGVIASRQALVDRAAERGVLHQVTVGVYEFDSATQPWPVAVDVVIDRIIGR